MSDKKTRKAERPASAVCAWATFGCDNPRSHGTYCYYHRESARARFRWWLIQTRLGRFVFWRCGGMFCRGEHPDGYCWSGCGFGRHLRQTTIQGD